MGQFDTESAGVGGSTAKTQRQRGSRTTPQSRTLLRHFKVQTQTEYDRDTSGAFRAHVRLIRQQKRRMEKRRRQQKERQQQQDRTIGINTLNVRGLAMDMKNLGMKLQGLKEQHARGNRDVVFIQETHLRKHEQDIAARHHAAMWGFKQATADQLSFWASGGDRRAGVAILVNPYGAVSNMKPWMQDQWTEHLIMTTGELDGKTVHFVNVYAPVNGEVRVQFFRKLGALKFPQGVEIVCGGDFNCVSNPQVDRVGGSSRPEVGAAELRSFLEQRGLYDSGYFNLPDVNEEGEKMAYAKQHHTHFHTSATGHFGSSRLDRFYVSATLKPLVRGVETEDAVCRTDHRAVLLELHSPRGVLRVRKRPKLYPPPAYVYAASRSLIQQSILALVEELKCTKKTESAAVWDRFKRILTEQLKKLKQEARRRMTCGYRQRIKRLKKQLEKCSLDAANGTGERRSILEALHQAQEARRVLKRRVVISQNAWSSTASTKAFFRRVCNKFGDSAIPTLSTSTPSIHRQLHDKANILKDSWEATFNGQAEAGDDIEAFISRYSASWEQVDLSDIDEAFTDEEVRAAIMGCKSGKACGPDELSNEWYKDNVELLIPVLTKLYNDFMETGDTPSSFLEAYIQSISKGGDTANPMNYRPIALLNTDYKIFTRVIAWRVRRHIECLVSNRQCGFVPGRTIHEVIDLFEAAKATCKTNAELSQAQVLMLDFAKAYDSLDRNFLLAMMEAKGFPPKLCRLVRAIHTNTTVKFLANGTASENLSVTSGIRQGCPLAPLLFIIAVDLLYDVLEAETGIVGINFSNVSDCRPLKVAGYADDTAIYIAHVSMQTAALSAVRRFSAVSGLKLNISKSVAMNLGSKQPEEHAPARTDPDAVKVVQSTRYLGHVAGTADTTEEAWSRALDALRIRLVLAEKKTNTVQQRGQIAAAIIIPKMLYVARHAWPTEAIVKQAQRRIKNYVWRSSFTDPERAPAGWIQADVAEQPAVRGGIGIPNLGVELIAMSAMVVGDWAQTYEGQRQVLGDVLQTRDTGSASLMVPRSTEPPVRTKESLWATGRPWTEWGFGHAYREQLEEREETRQLRKELRASNGVHTTWGTHGLQIQCEGRARKLLQDKRNERHKAWGECRLDGVMATLLTDLTLADATGEPTTWTDYRRCYTRSRGVRVEEVINVMQGQGGSVTLVPLTYPLPMSSAAAHCFREIGLCLVANYPEIICRMQEAEVLTIQHKLEDPHHVFVVASPTQRQVIHEWGTDRHTLAWQEGTGTLKDTVATFLAVPPQTITIAPHPWLNRMRPRWVGKRRWCQSRRRYKTLINTKRDIKAAQVQTSKQAKLERRYKKEATALAKLDWKRLQRMEGVSPYMTQNILKLRLNRLRLWTSADDGYDCLAHGCEGSGAGGTMHLAWACPEAQRFWEEYTHKWGRILRPGPVGAARRHTIMSDILGFKLRALPRWVVEWGQNEDIQDWNALHRASSELWTLGAAVVLTSIWRRNIDRGYPDGRRMRTLAESVTGAMDGVAEAYARYRLRRYPVTPSSLIPIQVTEAILRHWMQNEPEVGQYGEARQPVRIGFFDGGSRGNPGPGGSGSVFIELAQDSHARNIAWAAATALGCPTTTNNVAEFVGLHRLLTHAAAKGWTNFHVVGDSAMILKLMENRKEPKSKKLKNWYTMACRLADICQVTSWTHHYRAHNKMADWLANVAMDEKRSRMVAITESDKEDRWIADLMGHMDGDVQQWEAAQK